MKTARPYRSHRYPACVRCHKRRSRCVIDILGQSCALCQTHGVLCSLASTETVHRGMSKPKLEFVHRSLLVDDRSLEDNARVMAPELARDTQILDQYLPHVYGRSNYLPPSNHTHSRGRETQKAIYHVPIPARMPSPTGFHSSMNLPLELLAQVDPYLDELMSNYFEHIAPCYPLTDEKYIMTRIKNRNTIPQAFLIVLISHALFYWDLSPALAAYTRPDQDLAWHASVTVNTSNMQKGDIATISTICIGISGRPCQRLVHNAAHVARSAALAYIIGLNHDGSEWEIRDLEKNIRWKVWWALLIQDRWFNFAQGTPPYIAKGHYDVPIPTVEFLTQGREDSIRHIRAAEVYIQLCKLTEILGDVLPLIHRIHASNESIVEQASRTEIELDQWLDGHPTWLNIGDFYTRPAVPGLVNLQLSYLSLRMLIRRISWHETQSETGPPRSWLLGRCKTAAEDIVHFVTSLEKRDLMGFWLPYNAHHFTSAATLLLRCALQTSDGNVRVQCMTSARTLVDYLRRYQEEDKWDLANTCLTQGTTILTRIEEALPRTQPIASAHAAVAPATVSNHDIDANNDYRDDGMVNEGEATTTTTPDDEFALLHGQNSSLEELFPELFGENYFSDNFLVGQEHFAFED